MTSNGQQAGETIKVAVRARPFLSHEKALLPNHYNDVFVADAKLFICNRKGVPDPRAPATLKTSEHKAYEFDSLYDGDVDSETVYAGCGAQNVVHSFLKGVNGTVFVYGQTGTGKTHTMSAFTRFVAADTFDIVAKSADHVTVKLSVVEVYNERIRDLVTGQNNLHVRQRPSGGVEVEGLSEHVVTNSTEVHKFIERAVALRVEASTDANSHSSRSHLIVRLNATVCTVVNGQMQFATSQLNLVDLAGSERVYKANTVANATRLKESNNINRDLLCLGNVISALALRSEGKLQQHVPYRSSKLTRLLQDALGGNAVTVLVACISKMPEWHLEQTKSTLDFAARAAQVVCVPRVNITSEAPAPAAGSQVDMFSREIERLKAMLEEQLRTEARLLQENRELKAETARALRSGWDALGSQSSRNMGARLASFLKGNSISVCIPEETSSGASSPTSPAPRGADGSPSRSPDGRGASLSHTGAACSARRASSRGPSAVSSGAGDGGGDPPSGALLLADRFASRLAELPGSPAELMQTLVQTLRSQSYDVAGLRSQVVHAESRAAIATRKLHAREAEARKLRSTKGGVEPAARGSEDGGAGGRDSAEVKTLRSVNASQAKLLTEMAARLHKLEAELSATQAEKELLEEDIGIVSDLAVSITTDKGQSGHDGLAAPSTPPLQGPGAVDAAPGAYDASPTARALSFRSSNSSSNHNSHSHLEISYMLQPADSASNKAPSESEGAPYGTAGRERESFNASAHRNLVQFSHGKLFLKSAECMSELVEAVAEFSGYLEMIMAQQTPTNDGYVVDLMTLQQMQDAVERAQAAAQAVQNVGEMSLEEVKAMAVKANQQQHELVMSLGESHQLRKQLIANQQEYEAAREQAAVAIDELEYELDQLQLENVQMHNARHMHSMSAGSFESHCEAASGHVGAGGTERENGLDGALSYSGAAPAATKTQPTSPLRWVPMGRKLAARQTKDDLLRTSPANLLLRADSGNHSASSSFTAPGRGGTPPPGASRHSVAAPGARGPPGAKIAALQPLHSEIYRLWHQLDIPLCSRAAFLDVDHADNRPEVHRLWRNEHHCRSELHRLRWLKPKIGGDLPVKERLRAAVGKEHHMLEAAIARLGKQELAALCTQLGLPWSKKQKPIVLAEAMFDPCVTSPEPSALAFHRLMVAHHGGGSVATRDHWHQYVAVLPAVLLESLYNQHAEVKSAAARGRTAARSFRLQSCDSATHRVDAARSMLLTCDEALAKREDEADDGAAFGLNPIGLPPTWGDYKHSGAKALQSVGF